MSDLGLPTAEQERAEIGHLLGERVVLDTKGHHIILGVLTEINDCFYVLDKADIHDSREVRSSREVYTLEAAKHGVRKNRERVHVRRGEMIALSALDEVSAY